MFTAENKDTTSYNKLLSYPFPAGELGVTPDYALELCCDGSQCQHLSTLACVSKFNCSRLGGKIACNPSNPTPASSKCQGIIGSEAITANAVDRQDGSNCVNSPVSIVIPLTNCLKTITPIGLEQGYADYDIDACPVSASGGLRTCSWDNQGMVCTSGYYCWLQFPFAWPGTADKNPTTYLYTQKNISIVTQTASSLPSSTISTTPTSDEHLVNDHLVERIAVPIGSVTGVSLTTLLTWLFCKKRKKRQQLLLKEQENSEIVSNNFKVEALQELEFVEKVEVINPITQPTVHTVKELATVQELTPMSTEITTPELTTLTPPSSPVPQLIQSQPLSTKQILLNELKAKLIGNEQLWTDYLEVTQVLTNNPTSQFVLNGFHNLQNQLLQIFTISEIGLLLEDNHHYTNNEYTELIEEARNPQWINTRNPEWRC